MRCILLLLLWLLVSAIGAAGQQIVTADGQVFEPGDIKSLEAWARADTNDPHRLYYLALAYWQHHRWRQADSLLRSTLEIEPRYSEACLALYYLPFSRRSKLFKEIAEGHVPKEWMPVVDEAERFYRRAFRTNPFVDLRILSIAFDIKEPRSLTPLEYVVYRRLYAWQIALTNGRYDEAYELLDELAQRDFDERAHPEKVPDHIILYRGLAAAHTKRYEAAINDFRVLLHRALERARGDTIIHVPLHDNEYRFMLAALHHIAGHPDSAMALYQEALVNDLGLAMAHTFLAGLHESAGRMDEAIEERRRAVDVTPDDPSALFDFGVTLFNVGRASEAEDPLRRAMALSPRYPLPYYVLGRVYEALGQRPQARQQYTVFLARASLQLKQLRADAEHRLGDADKQ